MWKVTKTEKIMGILFILAGLFFFISEYITLSHATLPTLQLYIGYSVSELAVPVGDIYFNIISTLSPKANLLNNGIVLAGVVILIGNFVAVRKHISEYKPLFYLITLVLSFGFILVAAFHTGGPTSEEMHKLGAMMLFFGGSFLLIFIGFFVTENPLYKNICLALGFIGLICGIGFCLIKEDPVFSVYRGIVERGNIYSTIIWMIITGITLVSSKTIEKIEKKKT